MNAYSLLIGTPRTKAESLVLPAFAAAQVLSGQARLSSPITWRHVSEIADAARFLSGEKRAAAEHWQAAGRGAALAEL